jgi:hypothetical protein
MLPLYQHLKPDYQEKCLEKWSPVLDMGEPIKDIRVKMATAIVLENTQMDFVDHGLITESYTGQAGGFGAQAGATPGGSPAGGGALGTAFNYGTADSRIPAIVVPTIRRIFPELVAHDIVGVQPMNGPVGFAFAKRSLYGVNGKGGDRSGTELGYNYLDSGFTGASGNALTGSYWEEFGGPAGGGASAFGGTNAYGTDGQAAELGDSEWWNVGEDMPMATFRLEKGAVVAKTRKLAAHYSLELAEDMMKMHGIDVDSEMVNDMSYEIQAEIDRQIIAEMVKAAISAGNTSNWSPVSADGENQLMRIGTLYTQILDRSNLIAIKTRRGPANFAVASPRVCALLERLGDYFLDKPANKVDSGVFGISKVGTLRSGSITLYRDTFAYGNYVLLGYKGKTPVDSGIVYCPYIPLQLHRAIGPDNFSPRLGIRTRYGVLSNMFGANLYYQFIKVSDLTNTLLADYSGRVFMY